MNSNKIRPYMNQSNRIYKLFIKFYEVFLNNVCKDLPRDFYLSLIYIKVFLV